MINIICTMALVMVFIEVIYTLSPYSWESCIKKCKLLQKQGVHSRMVKEWYGWRVVSGE